MHRTPREVLDRVFGYGAFRGEQEAIIGHVAGGGDCLVVMPTGGGKSLCYQIPALLRVGVAVVVSPGQPHIKSLSHQYVISEAIVQRRPDTLLPDTDLRWLALQQINRHMSNHSHIMRRVASTNPTLVFTERPGGRGRLPARGSHRSGRARFEHPAPRTMDSLRNGTHCAPRTLEGGDRSCATRRIAPTSSARATNAGPATCAIASRLRIGSVATPWRCR